MNPNDIDIVEVLDSAADRPAFSDRGDSVVDVPKSPAALAADSVEAMSDAELMAGAGVEPVFSTSETAEFFDRSNQWLYWGLREGVFTDDDGKPLNPERIGDPRRGRRRFTLPIIENIMRSSYRRGNLDPEHLKTVMRRIKYAQAGVEWREREGWRYTHLGRNRHRWVRPEDAMWDAKAREWVLRPEAKIPRDD